jgi:hypothetical protein
MAAGESPIKQAVKLINKELDSNPGADRVKVIDEVARRLDLSPLEVDFLLRELGSGPRKAG